MGSGTSTASPDLADIGKHGAKLNAFASLYLTHTDSSKPGRMALHQQKAAFKIQNMWKTNQLKNPRRRLKRNSLLYTSFQPEAAKPPRTTLEETDEQDEDAEGGDDPDSEDDPDSADEEQESSGEDAEYGDHESDNSSQICLDAGKFAFEELLSAPELIKAIEAGKLADLHIILDHMIAQGISMDWMNRPLETKTRQFALHFAVSNGSVEIVDQFLKQPNIDVNVRQLTGRTPLICAARHGNMEVLDALLAHNGIMVNQFDNCNKTVRNFIC